MKVIIHFNSGKTTVFRIKNIRFEKQEVVLEIANSEEVKRFDVRDIKDYQVI